MQIAALAMPAASIAASTEARRYPPEHSPDDFRQEASSALNTLDEAIMLLNEIRSSPTHDALRGVQLAGEMVTLLSWASSELSDASAWTGGLGQQTGIDIATAGRAADRAADIWSDGRDLAGTREGISFLADSSEPFIEKAISRTSRALDNMP